MSEEKKIDVVIRALNSPLYGLERRDVSGETDKVKKCVQFMDEKYDNWSDLIYGSYYLTRVADDYIKSL